MQLTSPKAQSNKQGHCMPRLLHCDITPARSKSRKRKVKASGIELGEDQQEQSVNVGRQSRAGSQRRLSAEPQTALSLSWAPTPARHYAEG